MNSSTKSKSNPVITVVSIIIVAVALVVGYNLLWGGKKDDDAQSVETSQEQQSQPGDSFDSPVTISVNDMGLSVDEFIDKYGDKWIKFDGALGGTNDNKTIVYYGDDPLASTATFTSGASFVIGPSQYAFSDDLARFASDYQITNDEMSDLQKVTVVAQVTNIKGNNAVLSLNAKTNIDGSTPSIVSR